MSVTAMQLSDDQLNVIGNYVRLHLHEWIDPRQEMELRERIIRVEESLERQLALMKQGFEFMERRFEQVDKRFEQMERRFEQVDKRFEQMERRFEQVDKRFELVDKRFEELRGDMNKRFNHMFTFMTTGFVLLSLLMSVYRFLN